jgi:hypothetical protein
MARLSASEELLEHGGGQRMQFTGPCAFLAACVFAACVPVFERAVLAPASTVLARREPYAQVREVGIARRMTALRWDDSSLLATVVDISNTSSSAISIDVARATLTLESVETTQAIHTSAVGAGTGSLPAKAVANGVGLRPLTVLPGGNLTFWILFEPVGRLYDRRVTLSVPIQPGDPLVFTLHQAHKPSWKWNEPESETSLSLRLVNHAFAPDADLSEVGMALWHTRTSLKFGFSGALGTMYDRTTNGFQRSLTSSLEMSLGWHPSRWVLGAYGAGHATFVGSGEPNDVPSKILPGLSIGLECPVVKGRFPTVVLRMGYTHILANTGHRDGLSISIDGRFGR